MNPAAIRRLLHASSALVLILYFWGSSDLLRYGLLVATAVAIFVDSLRVSRPVFGSFLSRLVPVFRPAEAKRWSGATWLCVGYALTAWFPHPASSAGILAGAFADPAASLAGSRVANASQGKTWIGSGVAAISAAAVLWLLKLPLLVALGGAVAAMALERWSAPFDDNLVVAPGVALWVWLFL